MKTRLHEVWEADRGALNGWIATPSPMQAEMMALQDFDSITVDLQHGLLDYSDALLLMQTMQGHGKTMIARVPWNEPGIIMKLLDGGATNHLPDDQHGRRGKSLCRRVPVRAPRIPIFLDRPAQH